MEKEGCIGKLEQLGAVVIVPTYNNAGTIGKVLQDVLQYAGRVIVVNDGSTDKTLQILDGFPEIKVITYLQNRGKGFALKTGLRFAYEEGYRYVITIDSDGQHFAADIPVFAEAVEKNPDALLIGARNLTSDNMPGKNTFANRFSNFWFRLETGISLADTQSGFRLYPLRKLQGIRYFTSRYEFELEIIVRAAWRRIPVINIPVRVYYPPEGERVSHFRPFQDFSRISVLNSVFVLIAFFWYWPLSFFRGLTKENLRRFFRENVTDSGESNLRISLAVSLGLFMGIVPLWGYQMIVAVILAHFLKLNKIITLVFSNISIPPMIPVLLYGSYVVGGWALGLPVVLRINDITFAVLKDSLWQYLAGSFLLASLCSAFGGALAMLLLVLFRKKNKHTK